MTINDRIQPVRTTGQKRWGQLVCRFVCIISLMLQVLVPVSAQASEGAWIEICGESGAELVRVDVSAGETQPSDMTNCTDCGPCVLCAVAEPVIAPEPAHALLSIIIVHTQQPIGVDAIKPNAAQFWPDNRGPPVWQANTQKVDHSPMISSLSSRGAGS